MRALLGLMMAQQVGCGWWAEAMSPPSKHTQSPPSKHTEQTITDRKASMHSMQLTGLSGEVRVQITTSCNCAKKPTFNVSTTDKLITIQGVLPDGPLARCAEPCVLFTKATGLAPGDYRVIYLPDGAAQPRFTGEVEVH